MVVPPGSRSGASSMFLQSVSQPGAAPVLRVLLIEDSPVIREAVAEMIEADGCARVAFATDSETAAVHELAAARFDVLIVDLQLREGSGFGVLRALPELKPDALVIVLTNYASPAIRQRCAELGASFCLDKSSEFDEVPKLMMGWARQRGLA